MKRTQLVTGVAVASGLIVIAIFFIYMNPINQPASAAAGTSQSQSGLIVQDESIGTGAVAQAGSVVTVNYTGKLQDGTVFDTSIGRAPFQFTLGAGNVIPGWDIGLQGMKVGGKRLLIIPPGLAYGAQGNGPIPPNSTLVFEVDLLNVQSATDTGPALEGPSAQ